MRECGTPGPGETTEAMLERMQSTGQMSTDDADAVAEFAEFLRDMGPSGSAADRSRQRRALIKHAEFCGLSPSDVATLKAAEEIGAQGRAICPECLAGKCPNCDGSALDPVTDEITTCACDHGGPP